LQSVAQKVMSGKYLPEGRRPAKRGGIFLSGYSAPLCERTVLPETWGLLEDYVSGNFPLKWMLGVFLMRPTTR